METLSVSPTRPWGQQPLLSSTAERFAEPTLPFALEEADTPETPERLPFATNDNYPIDSPSYNPPSLEPSDVSEPDSRLHESHVQDEDLLLNSHCIDAAASLLQGRSLMLQDGSTMFKSRAPLVDLPCLAEEDVSASPSRSHALYPSFGNDSILVPAPVEDTSQLRLPGATVMRTGDDSYTVLISVRAPSVFETLADPMMLPRWNEAIPSVILVRGDTCLDVTTGPLVPPSNTSCWYHTARLVSTALGFPTYGQVHIFSEPQRGRLSLSVGSFPGGVELSHKITVVPSGEDSVRITDDIKVISPQTMTTESLSWFLPTLEDYMDQSASSWRCFADKLGTVDASSADAPLLWS